MTRVKETAEAVRGTPLAKHSSNQKNVKTSVHGQRFLDKTIGDPDKRLVNLGVSARPEEMHKLVNDHGNNILPSVQATVRMMLARGEFLPPTMTGFLKKHGVPPSSLKPVG
ncbi:hypothetical protein KKE03_02520 [Patescibacteria group bacterium]|nr:hypothetical protein [Patescibacteria group bacterium]